MTATSPRAYVYSAFWSEEGEEYVATCDAFPDITCTASTRDEALHLLTIRVEDALIDLELRGAPPPAPTLTRYIVSEFCEDRVNVRTMWDHALSMVAETDDDTLAAEVVLLLSEHQRGDLTLDEVRAKLRV